jgi:hypothetical protein
MSMTTAAFCVAPEVGGGEEEHVAEGLAAFRGTGAIAVKSAELEFVSVQPLPARVAAVVLERAGAAPPPS